MARVEIHPLARLFPPMPDAEFEALVTDIQRNGQRFPITLYEQKILDGVHRYRACKLLNRDPKVSEFSGSEREAADFVLSANLHRRQLNPSQLALIGARLANLREGRPPQTAQPCAVSQADAARKVGVSRRSVQSAALVLKHGTTAELRAVERGRKRLGRVARQVEERVAAGDPPTTHASPVAAVCARFTIELRTIRASGCKLRHRVSKAVELLHHLGERDPATFSGHTWLRDDVADLRATRDGLAELIALLRDRIDVQAAPCNVHRDEPAGALVIDDDPEQRPLL